MSLRNTSKKESVASRSCFKNRVILPFEGSYALFRHVIHHELVHAVLNDMFYGGNDSVFDFRPKSPAIANVDE